MKSHPWIQCSRVAFELGAIDSAPDIPGGIRTPDRSLRRRMLYPAELLRHAVFTSRIPIYFTAWDRLCQGLSGPGWPLFLAGRFASLVLSRDLATAPSRSALLLNLSPGLPFSASSQVQSPSHTKRDQDRRPSLLIVRALCLASCFGNGFSYQGFYFINSGALVDGFVSQGFHFLRVQLG